MHHISHFIVAQIESLVGGILYTATLCRTGIISAPSIGKLYLLSYEGFFKQIYSLDKRKSHQHVALGGIKKNPSLSHRRYKKTAQRTLKKALLLGVDNSTAASARMQRDLNLAEFINQAPLKTSQSVSCSAMRLITRLQHLSQSGRKSS
jgi:hypothetical protein